MLRNKISGSNSAPIRQLVFASPIKQLNHDQDDVDGIVTDLQTQDKIVTSDPHENKAKEFKDIACGTHECQNFMTIIDKTAWIQENDEGIIPYKTDYKCLKTFFKNYAGNRTKDINGMANCFLNISELLLEKGYYEYHKGNLEEMNWANKLKEMWGLNNEDLRKLINPSLYLYENDPEYKDQSKGKAKGRSYWFCSASSLITFMYQSSKHFKEILSLDSELLEKINKIDRYEVTTKGIYEPALMKYHKFLYDCFSYLLDILAKVEMEMSTKDTRLWLVPATKELLTIVHMGDVDDNFMFRESFYEETKTEMGNLVKEIDNMIKQEFEDRENYREIIVSKRNDLKREELKREELKRERLKREDLKRRKFNSESIDSQVRSRARNNRASVFVGNLHYFTTEQELKDAFAKYQVKSVKIIRDWKTGNSKFGFVNFIDPNCAAAAISDMDGCYLRERPLRVSLKN